MNNVRRFRKEKGMTQKQLGDLADVSQQQIQRIETGKSPISVDIAHRLASVLKVDVEALIPNIKAKANAFELFEKLGRKAQSVNAADDAEWTSFPVFALELETHFRSGFKFGAYIGHQVSKRVLGLISEPSNKRFACFSNFNAEVAINLEQLSYASIRPEEATFFVNEPDLLQARKGLNEHGDRKYFPWFGQPAEEIEMTDLANDDYWPTDVRILFASGEILGLSVFDEPEGNDREDGAGQVRNFLFDLDTSVTDDDEVQWLEDTEEGIHHFRFRDILAVAVRRAMFEKPSLEDFE